MPAASLLTCGGSMGLVIYRLDKMEGWCLVTLGAWVAFASVLNVAVWRFNV